MFRDIKRIAKRDNRLLAVDRGPYSPQKHGHDETGSKPKLKTVMLFMCRRVKPNHQAHPLLGETLCGIQSVGSANGRIRVNTPSVALLLFSLLSFLGGVQAGRSFANASS